MLIGFFIAEPRRKEHPLKVESYLFAALGDYKESASLVTACDYAIAQNTYDAGEYAHAAELFTALGD